MDVSSMNETNSSEPVSAVKRSGLSAKSIAVPAVLIILILHLAIIGNAIRINRVGRGVSRAMESDFAFTQIAKTLQSSADLLSDKSRLYVSTGDAGYLNGYFTELRGLDARDAAIQETLSGYRFDDAQEQLHSAILAAEDRARLECRAMRLCADAMQVDLERYPEMADTALTAEEQPLSAAQKRQAASALLVSAEYLQTKAQVTEYIDRAVQSVSDTVKQDVARQEALLRQYQTLQWAAVALLIAVLVALGALIFFLLLRPLERCADQVQRCEIIPPNKGLAEFRRLAHAYNSLLQHRQMTERDLHRKSQTDVLTGLPNRLAFETFVAQLSRNNPNSSVIVFSLDVNGLKETNDQEGHAFGDALLRNCAECIRVSFGEGEGRQCFRFGGDEFSAFWVDVPLTELDAALEKFKKEQVERDVSISLGYANVESLGTTTIAALYEEADKKMYEDKAEYHRRQAQEVLERLKLLTE